MQFKLTVLQAIACAHRDAEDKKSPTHAQVAMQSADGDTQFSLLILLDGANEFVVGSEVTVTIGRIH